MSNRDRGLALLVIGGLIILIALGADAIGFGAHPGVGWKQIGAAVVGAVAVGVGIRDLRRRG